MCAWTANSNHRNHAVSHVTVRWTETDLATQRRQEVKMIMDTIYIQFIESSDTIKLSEFYLVIRHDK